VTDDADDLDRRLARLFEEGRRREDPEDHPAPEKLSAYHAKELPPEEADAIQEHVVQCAFCTGLLLDLESFLKPQEEEAREGVADLGTEAGWRKLREEMGWRERREEPAAEVARLRRRLRVIQRWAAVFLVGILGLSAYTLRLWKEARASETLVSSTPTNEIGKRGIPEEEVETLKVSPGDSIVFTLFDLRKSSGECQVEILDAGGKRVWSRSGLMKR